MHEYIAILHVPDLPKLVDRLRDIDLYGYSLKRYVDHICTRLVEVISLELRCKDAYGINIGPSVIGSEPPSSVFQDPIYRRVIKQFNQQLCYRLVEVLTDCVRHHQIPMATTSMSFVSLQGSFLYIKYAPMYPL